MSFAVRVLVLGAVALVLSGCSSSVGTSSSAPGTITLAKQGVVMGGPTPVTNAAIQMYATGAGGDGTAAIPLGTQLPTDGTGTFSLSGTYHCPDPSSLVYGGHRREPRFERGEYKS